MRSILPTGKLWMEDGKNEEGKVVTNPTIGYGQQTLSLAKGKSREMFQIGVAKTKIGFSIYLLGIRGKLDLPELCHGIGKAKTSGYCISFKKWGDLIGIWEQLSNPSFNYGEFAIIKTKKS